MITQDEFLKCELDWGIGFHNPSFIALCDSTAKQIKDIPELANVKTILDYGGGTGVYSQSFFNEGYDVSYYDIYKSHVDYVKEKAPNLKIVNKPITTDLMVFIEVAEHMTDIELNKLFKQIKPDYILFSSTSESKPEFDIEWGHINIKQQNEWIEFWKIKGYEFVRDMQNPTTWTKLFKKI